MNLSELEAPKKEFFNYIFDKNYNNNVENSSKIDKS